MNLQQVLNGISYKIFGGKSCEVTSLACDTRDVKKGCLFFCLKGSRHDGHDFFRKAIGDGAVAVVCEKSLPTQALQIVVDDVRSAMAVAAKNFFDSHVDDLRIIAVVGTNGKTSTSYILQSILSKAGYNTAVIGTNGIFFNGQKYASTLTTPDPIALHYWFAQMYLNRVKYVVMEVSAHAIALQKMRGICCDTAIYTNFSQDHLDYFKTMQRYAECKKNFFCEQYVKNAVVNVDDELGQQIAEIAPSCATYAIDSVADVTANKVDAEKGCSFEIDLFGRKAKINSPLSGKFNVYNILAAATCAALYGVDIDTITEGIAEVERIDGRNETMLRSDNVRIVVDFAHTPDGIENILSYLKSTTENNLIVVFGCGGNRDKFKRPLMAEKVSKYADFAVVTNDNPRFEDPVDIANDVVCGLSCKYKTILNRSQATEYALSVAASGDTVAILGKGAECYQEVRGKKIPYSDIDVVRSLIRARCT